MNKEMEEILDDAKNVAIRFRNLTGKPLGITGEIAEFSAAKLLNLDLAEAKQAGYDATDSAGRTEIQTNWEQGMACGGRLTSLIISDLPTGLP